LRSGTDNYLAHVNIVRLLDGERDGAGNRFRRNRHLVHLVVYLGLMKLLADFEPKGKVAKQYGVYDDKDGFAERALFVIDKRGVIRYSFVSPIDGGERCCATQILGNARHFV